MELTITGIIEENYFAWKKIIFKIEIFCQKKKNLMKRYQYLEIYQHLDTQQIFSHLNQPSNIQPMWTLIHRNSYHAQTDVHIQGSENQIGICFLHWDDPEGWNGEGGGFRMGNTCIPVAGGFILMFGKTNTIMWSLKIK